MLSKVGKAPVDNMSFLNELIERLGALSKACQSWHLWGPRGDSTYERGRDARRKFWIKPLKETNLSVAQAFFDP